MLIIAILNFLKDVIIVVMDELIEDKFKSNSVVLKDAVLSLKLFLIFKSDLLSFTFCPTDYVLLVLISCHYR